MRWKISGEVHGGPTLGDSRHSLSLWTQARPGPRVVAGPPLPAWALKDIGAFVLSENLHRRHLDAEARQRVVALLRAKGESTRAIAEKVGVSQPTVLRDTEKSGDTNVSPDTKRVTGKDGKNYPARRREVYRRPLRARTCTGGSQVESGNFLKCTAVAPKM